MQRKTILITGVSSGIGLATARLLKTSGHNVAACCREASVPKISSDLVESDNFRIVKMDVTDSESRTSAVSAVVGLYGPIDVLINNAGVSYRTATEEMGDDDDLHQLATNYLGPLSLVRHVVPAMRERRSGLIINVSSVGGMMAMPLMGAYSASKFALEGASESLWYELRPWGISVVLVQPGFVNSDGFRRVLSGKKLRATGQSNSVYHRVYEEMTSFIERGMKRARATPESIARRIVALLDDANPPLRVPVTIDAHIFGMLRRFVPRRLYHFALYRALPGIDHWSE